MKFIKRPLTDTEREECSALKAAFTSLNRSLPKGRKITQEALAAALGMNQGSLSNYLNGHRAINKEVAAGIAKHTGIPVGLYSPRLENEIKGLAEAVEPHAQKDKESNVIAADFSRKAERSGFIEIPQLDVKASMGLGAPRPEHDVLVDTMTVSVEFLKQQRISYSDPGQLALITGYGDSMEGTFSDGDVLLVDRTIDSVKIDAVYVLALNDELYIKRLQRRGDGSFLMISDNTKYQPIPIEGKDLKRFQVLGRVVMAWNAKRM